MLLANKFFYRKKYLNGRKETVPYDEFNFWSRKASFYLDAATFGRIDPDNVSFEVKLCTCELAEAFYLNYDQAETIKSESIGSYTVSYADRIQSPDAFESLLKSILRDYLSDTGLLFRGV